jgi:hypothetical protein
MKKLLWSLFTLFSIALIIISTPLTKKIALWITKSLIESQTGTPFEYDDVHFRSGTIVFENPLIHPSILQAKQLSITPSINLYPFTLNLEIHIHQPHCSFSTGTTPLISIPSPYSKIDWIQPSFKITEGTLGDENCLYELSNINNRPTLNAHFNKANLFEIFKVLQLFIPALNDFKICSGTVEGDFQAVFLENSPPIVDGTIDIRHWAIQLIELPHFQINGGDAHLNISNGILSHSLIKLQLGDLKGLLDVKWRDEAHLFTLNLKGKMSNIENLLPDEIQSVFQKTFNHDSLNITATINNTEVKGVAHIGNNEGELIHFGAHLNNLLKGWFYAARLPVEKYFSPFIFSTGAAKLSGVAEVMGSFNSEAVEVKYEASDLILENKYLRIERPTPLQKSQRGFSGRHHYRLNEKSYEGSLIIENASYLEKNTGLLFNQISSQVFFQKGKLHLANLEAFCQGARLFGSADFNYEDPAPGVFDVHFKLPEFDGTVDQFQRVFSNLDTPESLSKLPVKGNLIARSNGAQVDFYFTPEEDTLKTVVEASLIHGLSDFPSLHLTLKDLSTDIDYDHSGRKLTFSDLQGSCFVGSGDKNIEYLIEDSSLTFKDIRGQEFDLDLHFFEKSREVARIKGEARLNQDNIIQFETDPILSHIAAVHPKKFHLFFNDSGDIDRWDLDLKLCLKPFLNYLYQLKEINWLFLSKQMIKKGKHLEISGGNCCIEAGYRHGTFNYSLKGEDLACQSLKIKNYSLFGKKQDRRWIIEDLIFDQLQLSAEIIPQEEAWKIQFLGLKYGDNLLIGLDGIWNELTDRLETRIHLLEYDTEGEKLFEKWVPGLLPIGKICGQGTLNLSPLPFSPWFQFQTDLNLQTEGFRLGDLILFPKNNFQLQFDSATGLTLHHLAYQFKKNEKTLANIACERFAFNPVDKEWKIEQLDLYIPRLTAPRLMADLQQLVPNYLSLQTPQLPLLVDMDEDFKVTLDLQNQRGELYSKLQCAGSCWYIENNCNWPEMDKGESIFTHLTIPNHSNPLHLHWRYQSESGPTIQSLSGSYGGFLFNLNQGINSILEGSVDVDFSMAKNSMSTPIVETIKKLGINSCYRFQGKWDCNPTANFAIMDNLYFNGKVTGLNSTLQGYEIEKIEADVSYSPLLLKIENTECKDPAGLLLCDSCICQRSHLNSPWFIEIPKLSIKNFRPTLLKESAKKERVPGKARSLLVQRIEINNFNGELDETITWRGEGSLHFSNPSRKNCFYPLFTIPSELILRLGLDPHLLNPVSGSIYFYLLGDKFYFTRFKDMYSEGRGSKFYLDSDAEPSWIGIDGRLSVNVRMRQDNLLFKLAELFSVSVQGNILKPKYTLQRARSGKRGFKKRG